MMVIKLKSGAEIRLPLEDIEFVREVEPGSGEERAVAPHAYLHRAGVNRCAACWKDRADPVHTDVAVHER